MKSKKLKNEIRIHGDNWVTLRMRFCPCCKKHELITGLGDSNIDVKIIKMKKIKL